MASIRERLRVLEAAAEERGLTPVAWWIGARHHQDALRELETRGEVEVEAGRLVSIRGLEVKVLTESPERFALWCEEGALDL